MGVIVKKTMGVVSKKTVIQKEKQGTEKRA